tara:strand:- start:263 stop:520 length:258 start_codon:yes stop_codon:yes gene_type:complete
MRLAKEPVKLFGHVFTKGDPIIYSHRHCVRGQWPTFEDASGVYISHRSFSTWYNGIEYLNNRHSITIINKDGEQTVVDWIKPINK